MCNFWTTGIKVVHGERGWTAECSWQDGKRTEAGCMEGTINTRYYEKTIQEAIDYVLDCMNLMNIRRCDEYECTKLVLSKFALYRDEENEHDPEVLRQIKEEANRRGWECYIAE